MRRLLTVGLILGAGLLTGCNLQNKPAVVTVIVTPDIPPTKTLAPIVTTTIRFTATLPPSETPIPSPTSSPTETQPPEPPTATPTLSPTAATLGTVNFTSPAANLRSGPGQGFSVITGVKAGTTLIVLGVDSTKNWYNVRLQDGSREGWLSIALVTVSNASTVPVMDETTIAKQTVEAATRAVLGTADVSQGTTSPPRKAGSKTKNDVLAYCDSKTNGEARKTIPAGQAVTVWWSWFAKTPEEIADHINYSSYEVRVDGQLLKDWRNYKSEVIRLGSDYYVYWYMPIGTPLPGEHKIEYKVMWQQQISDGYQTYGPGGDMEVDTNTCVFTIK